MRRDDALDPAKLKTHRTGREPKYTVADLLECIGKKELRTGELAKIAAEEKGISGGTFYALLKQAKQEGKISKSKLTEVLSAA